MLKTLCALAVGAMFASGAAAANDLGFLRVDGAITLDASTPAFRFTTFEILPGASVLFIGLEAGDTLSLIASEAIRIGGAMQFAPANALRIEAPLIEVSASIALPGGSIPLIAGGLGGGSVTLNSGAVISVPGFEPVYPDAPERLVGNDVSLIVEPRGSITLQAAVPEADTWAMLAAGLALVGFAARR